ncbi:putative ATP-dependent RNA helicase DDX20 [Holothuria leucospilota]|uniref:RNA helicase n=1 Tax=Holothuria leucospilota TaxID=206669 RepID=A0A9Q1HIW1_HOLLE|nr:putative ATP-dependent RNA helicase DDX20 [Holothuria leucospilota]
MAAQKNIRTAHSLQERRRTTDVLSSENINVDFASLLLSEPVQKGLTAAGFEKPSPIQLKALPLGRCGLDLIVQAKSGTGKTCVFSVIALESIITASSSLQVLVLAPTREIAVQIQNVIQAIGVAMEGLKCHTFIGGTIFGQDRQHLKKCHIAVGTPGRIKQLIEYEVLKTESVRMFVLDEADKLLDEKFQASVNWIYHQLPENKQMLALSATYPESLAQQLTNYMRDPTFVRLNPRDLTLQGIKQFYKIVPGHQLPHKSFEIKADHLVTLLSQIAFNQCLIFSNFQSRAHNLCELLLEKGWPATYISGNQEQVDRMKAMAELKAYKCRILISTDLTSRGIDAENVNLIINLDVPADFKTYLHRIGRAGRFGTHGAAITLASEGQEVNLLKTVKKRSGSDIRLLPDPVPSNLLEMSAAEMQAEVLDPSDVTESAEMVFLVDKDSSQSQREENSKQSFGLTEGTKEQMNYPQITKDGEVDGEVNGNMATSGYPPAEVRYHVLSQEQTPVFSGDRDATANSEIKRYGSEEEEFERGAESDHKSGPGLGLEGGGGQVQARKGPNHRWMVNLEEWMLPIMVMQELRKTSRKRWTWEEAFKEFENKRQFYKNGKVSVDSGGGNSHLQTGNVSCRDDSYRASLKEDEEEGVKTSAEFEKDPHGDTSSKVDDNSDLGNELNAEKTEKMLENSDVYVEFQAMKALLEQCRTEKATLEGIDHIPRLMRQLSLKSEKVKSQKKTVLEANMEGEDISYKNLPRGQTKEEGDFEKEKVSRDFKLGEEGRQKEYLEAGGEGKIIGKQSERNTGKGFNHEVTASGDIFRETCDVYDVSSVERTSGPMNGAQLIRSTASLKENGLDDEESCEVELNRDERKLKSTGRHGNISKGNTSDKIWEYFKQYVEEEPETRLPSKRMDRMGERVIDNESANSYESDSDSLSSSSKSERSLENEQHLLGSKTSDLSTGSVKLNGCESSTRSDGERKLPRKGKPKTISKGQDINWDASYSHYPYYNGREWNETAPWFADGSYFESWNGYVHPPDNTGWGHGYGEMVHPHTYWDAYYKNY